jgi:hypothetical protein
MVSSSNEEDETLKRVQQSPTQKVDTRERPKNEQNFKPYS